MRISQKMRCVLVAVEVIFMKLRVDENLLLVSHICSACVDDAVSKFFLVDEKFLELYLEHAKSRLHGFRSSIHVWTTMTWKHVL